MQPVTFAEDGDFQLHQCMRAIDENVLISRLEPAACAAPDEILLPIERLRTTFALYPQLIENAEHILNECEINLDADVKNKHTYTGNVFDDRELLRQKAFEGMIYRYGTRSKNAYRRIEKELDIIEKMGFCAYFLIAWDIVHFAMKQGFYHVGRGSGANSVVAYCLKITDVDPIELDLYFERFLNPKRSSPPDFDLDFSWKDIPEQFALPRIGQSVWPAQRRNRPDGTQPRGFRPTERNWAADFGHRRTPPRLSAAAFHPRWWRVDYGRTDYQLCRTRPATQGLSNHAIRYVFRRKSWTYQN